MWLMVKMITIFQFVARRDELTLKIAIENSGNIISGMIFLEKRVRCVVYGLGIRLTEVGRNRSRYYKNKYLTKVIAWIFFL